MWKNIVIKAQELIKFAEGLKDKTGPERKAIVITGLCDAINLPFIPDWLEKIIEPILYGFIIDVLVKWWNYLTGRDLLTLVDNAETAAVMAGIVVQEIKALATGTVVNVTDVEAKFNVLKESVAGA